MRKRILVILLAGVMVLSFAACGSNSASEVPASEDTQEASTEISAAGEADTDTISLTVNTEGMGQVAQADEGEEFSTDEQITVTLSEDMELVAVFDME